MTPSQNNIRVVHLSFIFNGFPFGSKRAFILQNIHLVNMQCWALAVGEMHRFSGWASTGCCSHTYEGRQAGGPRGRVSCTLTRTFCSAGGSVLTAWGSAPSFPLDSMLRAHPLRANQGGNGLTSGPKGQSLAWTPCRPPPCKVVLRGCTGAPWTVRNLFFIKLIPCPTHCPSFPMVLTPLGRSMTSLRYWHYHIEELLKS